MKFKDLPIGAHYRIPSVFKDGVVLPTVRVKLSESHYKPLHPSHAVKRPSAAEADVVPVSDAERENG